MTMVAAGVVPEGGDPLSGVPEASFVAPLVIQLSREYGADPEEVWGRAVSALAAFVDARVQAFIPILVEKRVRETYRVRGADW